MTDPGFTKGGQTAAARIKVEKFAQKQRKTDNATRNRQALKKMSTCELWTGKTAEQLDADHAEQRARVLARWAS